MKSIIIGAGTYGEVYLSYLQEAGIEIVGFLDDNPADEGKFVGNIPVLGPTSILPQLKMTHGVEAVYCPIGNNRVRVRFLRQARKFGYETPNFIHSNVSLASDICMADKGIYILDNTCIMPLVVIEEDVMISVGAKIIHHTHLANGTFVSNGVNLGANINVKEYSYIGMGATIMTGVKELGEDCLIGAGAVVIRDVPDRAVMAGVPAKVIKYKDGYNCLDNTQLPPPSTHNNCLTGNLLAA